jgi:hypothetical protein
MGSKRLEALKNENFRMRNEKDRIRAIVFVSQRLDPNICSGEDGPATFGRLSLSVSEFIYPVSLSGPDGSREGGASERQ